MLSNIKPKMKYYLFFICLFSLSVIHAQTSIGFQSHAPRPGDKQQMLKADFITPTEAGTNQIWDFRNLSTYKEENSSVENAEETEQYGLAPSANISMNTGDNFRTFFQIDETSNQCLAYVGAKYHVVYSKAVVRMLYPFNYGNYYTNSYSAKAFYEKGLETDISGEYTFEADATGTLILPHDTLSNVLRIRTETKRYEFMHCHHSEMLQIKYLYYTQQRYPVFASIETRWITNKDTTYHRSCALNKNIEKQNKIDTKPIPSPVKKVKKEYTINISPNPFDSEFTSDFILEEPTYVTVELLSSEGHKLANVCASKTLNAGKHIYSYDAGHLANAHYILRFIFNDQVVVRQIIKTN